MTAHSTLEKLFTRTQETFKANRRILSFDEYITLALDQPNLHARSAAQYMRDCFDWFGSSTLDTPRGPARRFHLFDCPWGDADQRLAGQEDAQEGIYRTLSHFIQEGRVQRLLLLHGPNGSAKSSIIRCIMRALEVYSHTDEGAIYSFNWVFPTEHISRGSIGFGGQGDPTDIDALDTYAFLDELSIDARIVSDLRDHPMLLLPQDSRNALLGDALQSHPSFILSDYLASGDLSHMSKKIFDALLNATQGDLKAVLRHVQVQRFFFSRRYRVGAVTIEPQLRVDAGTRQITANRSLQALPTSLQNQTLFEPFGDLVDANRGVIEYNDIFKRQLEFNKYLLSTSEKGTVSLDNTIVFLDTVFLGSANETYLDAFKSTPDYPSFKGRLELIRMPYLLDYTVEQYIYQDQLSSTSLSKPVLPHTTTVAALWAVLTRLTRPEATYLKDEPKGLRDVIQKLQPLEKALLYAHGTPPEHIPPELSRALRKSIPKLLAEGAEKTTYEGRHGASPREMKAALLNAAQRSDKAHLSPLTLLEELRALVKDPTVYTFLQMKPQGAYHRHEEYIDIVSSWYFDLVDQEVRAAMGLIDEGQYTELFERYIAHATHWARNEQLYNRATGTTEDPDVSFMTDVETRLDIEDPESFRKNLITTIAAWSIDNIGRSIVYDEVFPEHVKALKEHFFSERHEQTQRIRHHLLLFLDEDATNLSPAEVRRAEKTLDALIRDFGYTREGVREVIIFLVQNATNPSDQPEETTRQGETVADEDDEVGEVS